MKKVDFSAIPALKWVKAALAIAALIFVTIWTGNYWPLIFLPVVFDMYITKYIHWCFWLPRDGSKPKWYIEWLDAILYALFWVYLINLYLLQMYQIPTSSLEKSLLVGDHLFVSKLSYGPRMPNAPIYMPMTQNTLPVLNTKSYLEWPLWNYHRLAGLGSVQRNDIVVFNFPAGDTVCINMTNPDYYTILLDEGARAARDNAPSSAPVTFTTSWERNHYISDLGRKRVWSVKDNLGGITWRPVDKRDCYVKRCIGLPGDTLTIRDNTVYINSQVLDDAPEVQHIYHIKTTGVILNSRFFEQLGISNEDREQGGVGPHYYLPLSRDKAEQVKAMPIIESIEIENTRPDSSGLSVYPFSTDYQWSRDNYGPIWIPKSGVTVELDSANVLLYERIITAYEGHTLQYRKGKIYIDGNETTQYTFQMDYYWMMGDNRHKSADSRYWGFVPEDHIVGKPLFVWLSLDKDKPWYNSIRWDRMFMPVK